MKTSIDLTTEKGCIDWVRSNMLLFIKPKDYPEQPLIDPFSSAYAKDEVINALGKELFKMIEESKDVNG